jgi:hypothetical protein
MCKHQPELEAYASVFSEAERSGTQLPESLLQRLAEVKERVDAASKEAAAADAAVHAVQQVRLARLVLLVLLAGLSHAPAWLG